MTYTYFLEANGEDDFAAMTFIDHFDVESIAADMLKNGERTRIVYYPDGDRDERIYLTLHKIFGDVPQAFIDLASDVWGDYDQMKAHDIFPVYPVRNTDASKRPIYAEDLKEFFAEDGHLSAYIEEFIDRCPTATIPD